MAKKLYYVKAIQNMSNHFGFPGRSEQFLPVKAESRSKVGSEFHKIYNGWDFLGISSTRGETIRRRR